MSIIKVDYGELTEGGGILKPSIGDIYKFCIRSGGSLSQSELNQRFDQIGYDVSDVSSALITYVCSNASSGYGRGTVGVDIDGTEDVIIATTAHSTSQSTKTIDLSNKKSIILYAISDQNPAAFGDVVSGEITFS